MGMEILTVIKFLEDHKFLLEHADEAIAVLTTLLVDQDLLEDTQSWYHSLSEWRKIKLADDVSAALDAQPSDDASRLDASAPPHSTDALRDGGRSQDPPSTS
jgi:hypothetical protein